MANESITSSRADAQSGHGEPHARAMVSPPSDGHDWETEAVDIRIALEEAVAAVTRAAQQAFTYAGLLDEVLAMLESDSGTPVPAEHWKTPITPDAALSPRECEVLALVAEGRSNKAIAEALYVSPNTVKTHVGSLLSKLRVESRVQLAALAQRQALFAGLKQPTQRI
jgi:DNA-binding NarL/FixJ family response regulator